MNLTLTAFGQSKKYTIRERTDLIINFHKKISDIIGQNDWKIYNKKTAIINICDYQKAYPEIYTQVKQGLNSKLVKPIRYKEDDIADITSSCNFYNIDKNSFNVEYSLGYPSNIFPSFRFGITSMTDQELFTKDKILEIAHLVIRNWNPEMLCVTNPDFFHTISKSHKHGTPWSGWFTYVSKSLEPNHKNKSGNIDIASIIDIQGYGKIYWVTDDMFDMRNKEHILKALTLEKYFLDNEIKMTWR